MEPDKLPPEGWDLYNELEYEAKLDRLLSSESQEIEELLDPDNPFWKR